MINFAQHFHRYPINYSHKLNYLLIVAKFIAMVVCLMGIRNTLMECSPVEPRDDLLIRTRQQLQQQQNSDTLSARSKQQSLGAFQCVAKLPPTFDKSLLLDLYNQLQKPSQSQHQPQPYIKLPISLDLATESKSHGQGASSHQLGTGNTGLPALLPSAEFPEDTNLAEEVEDDGNDGGGGVGGDGDGQQSSPMGHQVTSVGRIPVADAESDEDVGLDPRPNHSSSDSGGEPDDQIEELDSQQDYDSTLPSLNSSDKSGEMSSGGSGGLAKANKLWRHFKKPRFLARLPDDRMFASNRADENISMKKINHSETINSKTRLKREASSSSVDQEQVSAIYQNNQMNHLAQMITRLLMDRLQQRQLNNLLANPLVLLSGLIPIGTQAASTILLQSIDDLPVHMSNLGQLLANIFATLTVNNPMLTNSPILMRAMAQNAPVALINGTSSAAARTTMMKSIAINDTTEPDLERQRQQQQHFTSTDGNNLRSQRVLLNGVISNMVQAILANSRIMIPTTTTITTHKNPTRQSAMSSNSANFSLMSHITRPKLDRSAKGQQGADRQNHLDHQEAELNQFVNKLNALTLGQVASVNQTKSETNATQATSLPRHQHGDEKTIRHSRQKRSLGAMLLLGGPFSKIYMTMMMHRLVRSQSSALSQALMSELIRRYLIPMLSSVSGASVLGQLASSPSSPVFGVAQLFNQALIRNTGGKPAVMQMATAASNSGGGGYIGQHHQQQFLSNQTFEHLKPQLANSNQNTDSLDPLLSGSFPANLAAECQYVQSDGQKSETSSVRLQQLLHLLSPTNVLTSMFNNPLMSIDQRGLLINLPISRTSLLVMPNLMSTNLNGSSRKTLLRLLSLTGQSRQPLLNPFIGPASGGTNSNQLLRDPDSGLERGVHPVHGHNQQHLRPHQRLALPNRRPPKFKMAPPSTSPDTVQPLDETPNSERLQFEHLFKDMSPLQLLEMIQKFNSTNAAANVSSLRQFKAAKSDASESNEDNDQMDHQQHHAFESLISSLDMAEKEQQQQQQQQNYNKPSSSWPKTLQLAAATTATNNSQIVNLDLADQIAEKLLNKSLATYMNTLINTSGLSGIINETSAHDRDVTNSMVSSIGQTLRGNGLVDSLNTMEITKREKKRIDGQLEVGANITSTSLEKQPSSGPAAAAANKAPNQIKPAPDNTEILLEKLIALIKDKDTPSNNFSDDTLSSSLSSSSSSREQSIVVKAQNRSTSMQESSVGKQLQSSQPEDKVALQTFVRPNTTFLRPPAATKSQPPTVVRINQNNSTTTTTTTTTTPKTTTRMLEPNQVSASRHQNNKMPKSQQNSMRLPEMNDSKTSKPKPIQKQSGLVVKNPEGSGKLHGSPPKSIKADKLGHESAKSNEKPELEPVGASDRKLKGSGGGGGGGSGNNTNSTNYVQQKKDTDSSQQQPLNNLAMALNVMNMVLLNRSLMDSTNNKNWDLSKSTTTAAPDDWQLNHYNKNDNELRELLHRHHQAPDLINVDTWPATRNEFELPPVNPKRGRKNCCRHKSHKTSTGKRPSSTSTTTIAPTSAPSTMPTTTTTTTTPEFELVGVDKFGQGNAGTRQAANHRTISNAIKLSSSVRTSAAGKTTPTAPAGTRPSSDSVAPKYVFKALIVSTKSAADNKANQQAANNSKSAPNPGEPEESDSDYAIRWNNILQHISLKAAAAAAAAA